MAYPEAYDVHNLPTNVEQKVEQKISNTQLALKALDGEQSNLKELIEQLFNKLEQLLGPEDTKRDINTVAADTPMRSAFSTSMWSRVSREKENRETLQAIINRIDL